uniref:Uncharacterized protein n=1 Tax=Panagrolaimus sp. PS1159 TaxID=55785 RepID=A0AC35FL37_9BILA
MINKVFMIKCYQVQNYMDEPVTESLTNCPSYFKLNVTGCLKYTYFNVKTVFRACEYTSCMVQGISQKGCFNDTKKNIEKCCCTTDGCNV